MRTNCGWIHKKNKIAGDKSDLDEKGRNGTTSCLSCDNVFGNDGKIREICFHGKNKKSYFGYLFLKKFVKLIS